MPIKSRLIRLYEGIVGSLDKNEERGFSTKKIAFAVVITCVIFIHASWLKHAFLKEDYKYMLELTIIDYLFALLIKGVVTLKEVLALKNGSNKVNEEKSKENEDTSSEVR